TTTPAWRSVSVRLSSYVPSSTNTRDSPFAAAASSASWIDRSGVSRVPSPPGKPNAALTKTPSPGDSPGSQGGKSAGTPASASAVGGEISRLRTSPQEASAPPTIAAAQAPRPSARKESMSIAGPRERTAGRARLNPPLDDRGSFGEGVPTSVARCGSVVTLGLAGGVTVLVPRPLLLLGRAPPIARGPLLGALD